MHNLIFYSIFADRDPGKFDNVCMVSAHSFDKLWPGDVQEITPKAFGKLKSFLEETQVT